MIRRPESPSDVAEHPSVAVCDDLIAACPAALTGMSGEEFERFSEIIAAALDDAFAAGADAQRSARAEVDAEDAPHELEPLRPLLNVLRSIHEHPGRSAPQMGHPIYWTFCGVTLIVSGSGSDRLTHALSCAVFDTLIKDAK